MPMIRVHDLGEGADMIEAFDRHQSLRGLSGATRKRRRWTLTAIADETHHSLAELTATDVETFLAARDNPATRRALLGDLRSFYTFACRRRLVDDNPTADIDTPKVPKRNPSPLATADLERAIAAADDRTALIIMLGAYAGLRVSEIAALHVEHIVAGRHLTVRQGKGAKDRHVPLHPRLEAMIAGRPPGPLVGTDGDYVSTLVRRHFRRLGIHHRAHDLRHTFCTEALRYAPMHVVAAWMGHENVATTQRYAGIDARDAQLIHRMFRDSPVGQDPPGRLRLVA